MSAVYLKFVLGSDRDSLRSILTSGDRRQFIFRLFTVAALLLAISLQLVLLPGIRLVERVHFHTATVGSVTLPDQYGIAEFTHHIGDSDRRLSHWASEAMETKHHHHSHVEAHAHDREMEDVVYKPAHDTAVALAVMASRYLASLDSFLHSTTPGFHGRFAEVYFSDLTLIFRSHVVPPPERPPSASR